jgi:hypothetical protein
VIKQSAVIKQSGDGIWCGSGGSRTEVHDRSSLHDHEGEAGGRVPRRPAETTGRA